MIRWEPSLRCCRFGWRGSVDIVNVYYVVYIFCICMTLHTAILEEVHGQHCFCLTRFRLTNDGEGITPNRYLGSVTKKGTYSTWIWLFRFGNIGGIMMGAACGAENADPSGAPYFTSGFIEVHDVLSFVSPYFMW